MTGPDAMSDADLALRFRQGAPSVFEDLVRRHAREAFAFCLRLSGDPAEAEELSQDGFVRAYRALAEFRGESTFRSWLFRILVNLHRDRARSRRRGERRLEEARQAAGPGTSEPAAGETEVGEMSERIRARVDELPERQREVLLLHAYQGLDYHEIAASLGCSYDDVKVNLSLARKRLRERLKEFL